MARHARPGVDADARRRTGADGGAVVDRARMPRRRRGSAGRASAASRRACARSTSRADRGRSRSRRGSARAPRGTARACRRGTTCTVSAIESPLRSSLTLVRAVRVVAGRALHLAFAQTACGPSDRAWRPCRGGTSRRVPDLRRRLELRLLRLGAVHAVAGHAGQVRRRAGCRPRARASAGCGRSYNVR